MREVMASLFVLGLCACLPAGCTTSIYHRALARQPAGADERLVVRVREAEREVLEALGLLREMERVRDTKDRSRLRQRLRVAGYDVERAALAIGDVARRAQSDGVRRDIESVREAVTQAGGSAIHAGSQDATPEDVRRAERFLQEAADKCRGFAGS